MASFCLSFISGLQVREQGSFSSTNYEEIKEDRNKSMKMKNGMGKTTGTTNVEEESDLRLFWNILTRNASLFLLLPPPFLAARFGKKICPSFVFCVFFLLHSFSFASNCFLYRRLLHLLFFCVFLFFIRYIVFFSLL